MKFGATAIIEDIKLPDYKGRHVFTAKFRLLVFVVAWIVAAFYFESLWEHAPWVPLVISIAFLVTGICYHNILKNRGLFLSFVLEMAGDLISITLVVYLTGGADSEYFTLYLMYCIAAGIFYNYQVATIAGFLSIGFFVILIFLLKLGWVEPFQTSTELPLWMKKLSVNEYGRLLFLAMFLPIIVYGVKISNFFSRLKERALEQRNKQLVALNRISATIRNILSVEKAIQQVLAGVIEGLGYEVCLLAMEQKETGEVNFYTPKQNPLIEDMEQRLGFRLSETRIPAFANNSILAAARNSRVLFRKKLADLVAGVQPAWPDKMADKIQKEMGFKNFVILPLVAERRVIGALVGMSANELVDESRVGVLENFTNQAALAIESAQLFSELKNKNLELERANKIKSEFLATMSHELRTPLTAIIGFSELLLEEVLGELNPEQKESLSEVVNNGEHLLHLINSILDLAKVEAGKMELTIEPFNLGELLQEVRGSIDALVKKKSQEFNLDASEVLPVFYADSRKIKQILLNLASNAIKFTPEQGKIIIRARHYLQLPSEINSDKLSRLPLCAQGYFEICVEDNGIGIEPQDLENIFKVFEQVDSSFTRKYSGTGLGLALTKQFVEMHQGIIWVESTKNRGSKFTLIIPAETVVATQTVEVNQSETFLMGMQQLIQGGER